jgi:hypothetical protein
MMRFALVAIISLFLIPATNAQYIEVNLTEPDPVFELNVPQNGTFFLNATVYCRGLLIGCGDVNGTLFYNSSSPLPDTPVNETEGLPFYIHGPQATSMIACPSNPLGIGEFCNVTWTVNATGPQGSIWKIGVLFNSSLSPIIVDNHTDNVTVSIASCAVDYNIHWSSIDFGLSNPSTENISAPGNVGNEYNLTVNTGSCATDFYINSTDLINITYSSSIPASNISWSNISSDINAGFFRMSHIPQIFARDVGFGTNVTTWYWLNIPAAFAGLYNATIFIMGVVKDSGPP